MTGPRGKDTDPVIHRSHCGRALAFRLALAALATLAGCASSDAGGGDDGTINDGTGPCAMVPPPTGGKTYSGAYGQGIASPGYTYNLYSDGTGTDSITVFGADATFSATWANVGDFLARVGLGFNSTKTPDQIGTITATFQETKTGDTGGFTYIGLYGWSVNPLHEYYIVEDWYGGRPNPGTKMGTITVDGGQYDVYTHTQNNQPAITGGNQTFVQYFSVRQRARTCGVMSVSQHFAAWANMNMTLGNLEEARLLIEAGDNPGGSITFSVATVTVD